MLVEENVLLERGVPMVKGVRAPRLDGTLFLCLIIAAGLRLFLIIHTQGVIEGDEALVGIQAQRILHGDFPIYFYGQPYMGSLEAYLVALLFAVFGPSVWAMRTEALVLSLVLIWLTWRLAEVLADTAHLSDLAKRHFVIAAGLCAAIPPLYDGIMQLHMLGGYIETFVLMMLLLLSALRLTQCWQTGASVQELALRWIGIGFIVGVGLWVDPLIASAVAAAALWILGNSLRKLSRHLLLALVAIPSAIIGMAPALGWGATHQWANVLYVFNLSGHEGLSRKLEDVSNVTKSFGSCVAPRLIGGGIPLERHALASVHTALFCVGLAMIVAALVLACIARPVRRLVGLPTLFAACVVFLYCVSSASGAELLGCENDWAGRYASPLMLVLPFLFAVTFTSVRRDILGRIVILAFLISFLGAQALTYGLTSPGQTYQSNYCVQDPFDNEPILNYLEQQRVRYFWANGLLAYPLVFKSHLNIIGVDPGSLLHPDITVNRIPSYTKAVLHADRPSMLFVIPHDDAHPVILQALEDLHIAYRSARFVSQPGDYDVLVVTPVNHTVSPLASSKLDLFSCVSQ
jgi:hypothetical protein